MSWIGSGSLVGRRAAPWVSWRVPVAVVALAAVLVVPGAAGADPVVTEFDGNITPGFTAARAPETVTTGPDGNIWFTESGDPGGLGRLNSDGTVTEFTPGNTIGFTANRQPLGFTSGPDGAIWFTEAGDPGGLGRLNGNGNGNATVTEFTSSNTTGFTANRAPFGITTGADGNIWFAERGGSGGLGRLNGNLTVTEFTPNNTTGFTANRVPLGITTGPDGNIWFTEYNNPGGLGRLNGNLTVTEFTPNNTTGFTANRQPLGITTGPDGNIWYTEFGSPGGLGRLNGNLTVTEFTPNNTTGFTANFPHGITTGPDGNIWFTETGSPGALGRLNGNLTVTEFTPNNTTGFTANRAPFGITTGPDGNIWFTENNSPGGLGRLLLNPAGGGSPPGGGPGSPPPGGASPPPSGGGVRDTFAPRFVRALAAVPARFRVGKTATALSSRKRKPAPVGTSLRFSLSEPATVTITFLQRRAGRKVKGVCRAPSRANRKRKRCTRYVAVGSLRRRGLQGTNTISFSGRIGKRPLAAGSYRASAVARDTAGNASKASVSAFTIVKR
jgi:virginiamycin B lyase